MITTVDIVDLQCGNAKSIENWLSRNNCRANRVNEPNDIRSDVLILPGVGAAGVYLDKLKNAGLDSAIKTHVKTGGRILGICLGFQILMEFTQEDGGVEGIGLFKGYVERLPGNESHNAWEKLLFEKKLLSGSEKWGVNKFTRRKKLIGRVFYNHEFAVVNESLKQKSLPISNGMSKYSSLIVDGSVFGCQFHPEKSQVTGDRLLKMIL
ncbi:imidazole glycerol phosphate synthase subunit HisH [Amylibacter sp.]|nr:imidazole glycerol phosphate synthase subunit HisH [Amylibacter sp.]